MRDSITSEFDSLRLGDKRLDKRCKTIAQRFAANPQVSINAASQAWNETHAAYELSTTIRSTSKRSLPLTQTPPSGESNRSKL